LTTVASSAVVPEILTAGRMRLSPVKVKMSAAVYQTKTADLGNMYRYPLMMVLKTLQSTSVANPYP